MKKLQATDNASFVIDRFNNLNSNHPLLITDNGILTKKEIVNITKKISKSINTESNFIFIAARRPLNIVSALLAAWMTGQCPIVIDNLNKNPWGIKALDSRKSALILEADFCVELDIPQLTNSPIFFNRLPQVNEFVSTVELSEFAYGVQTSGTTGSPKIALNYWRGLNNRLGWMVDEISNKQAENTLITTAPAYDSFLWQVLLPILTGGSIGYWKAPLIRRLDLLHEAIQKISPTIIDFTPTAFKLAEKKLKTYHTVRTVIFGGETLTCSTIQSAANHFPNARILNLYGPSECSIGSIWCDVTKNEIDPVPLGRPIPNTGFYISNITTISEGINTGSIVLTGSCVGAGYLDDTDLTKKRFCFSTKQPTYDTGDVGTLKHDNLYYLGRTKDYLRKAQDVKVHGIRYDLTKLLDEIARIMQPTNLYVDDPIESGSAVKLMITVFTENLRTPYEMELLSLFETFNLPTSLDLNICIYACMNISSSGKSEYKLVKEIRRNFINKLREKKEMTTPILPATLLEIMQHLGLANISLDSTIHDMGCDSLTAFELTIGAEEIGININFDKLISGAALKDAILPAQDCHNLYTDINVEQTGYNDRLKTVAHDYKETHSQKPKRVLLFGSTGFLGEEILTQLTEKNMEWHIAAVTRKNIETHKNIKYFNAGDLHTDTAEYKIKKNFDIWKPDIIINAAGSSNWRYADRMQEHLSILYNILASSAGIRMIHISSNAAAKINNTAASYYTRAKQNCEHMLDRLEKLSDYNCSIIRVGQLGPSLERIGTWPIHKSLLKSLIYRSGTNSIFISTTGRYDISPVNIVAEYIISESDNINIEKLMLVSSGLDFKSIYDAAFNRGLVVETAPTFHGSRLDQMLNVDSSWRKQRIDVSSTYAEVLVDRAMDSN